MMRTIRRKKALLSEGSGSETSHTELRQNDRDSLVKLLLMGFHYTHVLLCGEEHSGIRGDLSECLS